MGIFSTAITHTARTVRPRTPPSSRRARKTPCTRRFRGRLSQGREYSWTTGFYYFRARWYDPVTGRWLSPDPIGISGGLNQYVFVDNNPVNERDPSGLCGEDDSGDFDYLISVVFPGKRYPPDDWPDPGKKWDWDKESGRFKKGGKYRHWHEDDRHSGHWDEESKSGNGHENIYPNDPRFSVSVDPATVATGFKWATAGAAAYWFISEGSRIAFSPRNLIPIP